MEDAFTMAEMEAERRVMSDSIFDKIPKHKRVKRFIIERDDELIEQICERIERARELFDEMFEQV